MPVSRAGPVETRYAWYVVGVLTLANVSGFIDRQVLSLLVPAIERDLRITDTQMSYLIGLSFSVFYTVLGLPIAWWADRGNRRNIMAGGVTLWSVMTMLSGVVARPESVVMTLHSATPLTMIARRLARSAHHAIGSPRTVKKSENDRPMR